jgi:hypothetical protein
MRRTEGADTGAATVAADVLIRRGHHQVRDAVAVDVRGDDQRAERHVEQS